MQRIIKPGQRICKIGESMFAIPIKPRFAMIAERPSEIMIGTVRLPFPFMNCVWMYSAEITEIGIAVVKQESETAKQEKKAPFDPSKYIEITASLSSGACAGKSDL